MILDIVFVSYIFIEYKMLVSIILLGLQLLLISGETLDGTSTLFIKDYIEAKKINRIMIVKEKVGEYQ